MSGIMAEALHRLRRELGLEEGIVKVYDVFQMLGEVELDLVERFHVDVLPVEPPALFFGIRREDYKPWQLFDGTPVLVPGDFNVEIGADGSWLLHEGGKPSAPVVGRMPKGGYYFEDLSLLQRSDDVERPRLEDLREQCSLTDEELMVMAERAAYLRSHTDKALVAGFWLKSGLGIIGSLNNFLLLIGLDREYVKEFLHAKHEIIMENLKRLWRAIGDNIDVVGLEGFDFGTQRSELISPSDFYELYIPYYKEQNAWVHEHTPWKTFQHCCGSITKILPMLVETGIDALNPVQCTAAGMDPVWLKDQFGSHLTFWGGGVDTQSVLPYGSPEEVRAQVRDRIRIFAPGGGYVFCPVHNIQYGVPAGNIVAAYEAAYEYGRYPVV
ncbi:MAG: methyltransferase [Firmicutes bacterium]|nr:methyltransferase [Bacillota bacterium]